MMVSFIMWLLPLHAQDQSATRLKQRLNFARTYFEYGGSYFPSFTGKTLVGDAVEAKAFPRSMGQYLTWGGFHFWGHGEFYVTIPLVPNMATISEGESFHLSHSVATGFRYYPWVLRQGAISPYAGLSWGALEYQQKRAQVEGPKLSKDFMLNLDVGLIYQTRNLGLRLGLNYFTANEWQYPVSRGPKVSISTPSYSIQLGILYAFESSESASPEINDTRNGYPTISPLSFDTRKSGNLFLGAGPSNSYSLNNSTYNELRLPFLQEKVTSEVYVDISAGYHFQKKNLMAAISYRNPRYRNVGYDVKQKINKTSIALEVSKFLLDYSGFAPFVGINMALDRVKYQEEIDGVFQEINFETSLQPGFTFGWDIVPGKTTEALILRTNLRWYPFAKFAIDGLSFEFNQLEYNLIQVVFYPGRLK